LVKVKIRAELIQNDFSVGESFESVGTILFSIARLFDSSERQTCFGTSGLVDEYHTSLELSSDRLALFYIVAVYDRGKPKIIVVCYLDRRFYASTSDNTCHRSENFFSIACHIWLHICQYSRSIQISVYVNYVSACRKFGSLRDSFLHLFVYLAYYGLGGHRTELSIHIHRIADSQM